MAPDEWRSGLKAFAKELNRIPKLLESKGVRRVDNKSTALELLADHLRKESPGARYARGFGSIVSKGSRIDEIVLFDSDQAWVVDTGSNRYANMASLKHRILELDWRAQKEDDPALRRKMHDELERLERLQMLLKKLDDLGIPAELDSRDQIWVSRTGMMQFSARPDEEGAYREVLEFLEESLPRKYKLFWAGRKDNEMEISFAHRFGSVRTAVDAGEPFEVIDFVRGYKQITGVRRIPIARNVDPRTKQETVVVGNADIDRYGLRIRGKDYLKDSEMERLFKGEVVIEEKVDGHPVVILYGGYTFFCESLRIQHTVSYDNVPYSESGWPDMTVVYEIMEGEDRPPYRQGQGTGKWLTRGEKEAVCQMVGAPLVPLVFKGTVAPEDLPKLADRFSSFGAGTAEGIVVKNLRTGVFGKFINLEFQKAISEESLWGGVHPELRGIKNIRKRVAHKYLASFGNRT
jgi:hypothetical protein